MATQSREDSVYLAKLAEQAERYEGQWAVCICDEHTINIHTWRYNRDG